MIHMRQFNEFEIKNFSYLANLGIRYTTFQTYWTSLDKGYFDAIVPIRAYLKEEGIHDYSLQEQGPKEYKEGYLITDNLLIPARASLYRPKTKKGDPRLWFSKLHYYTDADDIFAMFHIGQVLYIINVTKTNVANCYEAIENNPIKEILQTVHGHSMEVSQELLGKFKKLYELMSQSVADIVNGNYYKNAEDNHGKNKVDS